MSMRVRELAKMVDHTLLKPDTLEKDIQRLCEEASRYRFASVCVPPCYVRLADQKSRKTNVKVGAVVSFPFGADTTAVKVAAVWDDAVAGGPQSLTL